MPVHALLLLAACALNVFPMLIHRIGGDILIRLTSIHCYATQFWQGDILPRWCFEGDAGLGSAIFAIFPPFSNIVAALLYPLHWAGASVYAVYVICVLLATLVTAYGSYKWLLHFAGPNAALVGAMLYVFMPYRSEVMVSRSGLPELWVMAFAPLMAHELRMLLRNKKPRLYKFSLWGTLAILSQPAVTLCMLIGMSVYAFIRGLEAPVFWVRYMLAVALMVLGASFYLLPAMHYMQFLQHVGIQGSAPVWANSFVLPLADIKAGRTMHIAALGILIAAFAILANLANARKRRIPQLSDRQEIRSWCIAGILSILLLFPISKPFWDVVNYVSHSGFPWRMQALLCMAVSFFAAVYVRWLLLPGKRQMAIGDLLTAVLFLFCFQMFMVRTVDDKDRDTFDQLVDARMMNFPEYRTEWVNNSHYDDAYILERVNSKSSPPQVEMLGGTAMVKVRQWGWNGIRLETGGVQEGFKLRIYHRYMPLWKATAEDGTELPIEAEEATGFMILTLPKGSWKILIHPESRWNGILKPLHLSGAS